MGARTTEPHVMDARNWDAARPRGLLRELATHAGAVGVRRNTELLRASRGGGAQEAGQLLLGVVLGAARCIAAPPLPGSGSTEPVIPISPVAGV